MAGAVPRSLLIVAKYGGAATVPPNAPFPQSPRCTGGPGQSSCGRGPSAKTIDDAAYPVRPPTPPTNATDSLVLVVPVLPMSGRVQPAARAAAAEVPETESWLSPAARVCASPGVITCSQACCGTGTGWPSSSVTDWIGFGGRHTPPLPNV